MTKSIPQSLPFEACAITAFRNEVLITGEAAVIYLQERNGERLTTIVDTALLPKIQTCRGRWYAWHNHHTGTDYVVSSIRRDGKKMLVWLHRLITDAPVNRVVDHIDHNSLNNQIDNLRVVTVAQNVRNRKGPQRNSTSGLRGVSWHKASGKWSAQGYHHRKSHYLGLYTDPLEAAKVAAIFSALIEGKS